MPLPVIGAAIGIWLAAVLWSDLRHRRIPNTLLLLLLIPALLAVMVNARGLLGVALWPSLAGLLVGGLPLLPGYAMGQMGAGDVKLAAVLGLLLGAAGALEMLLLSAVLIGGCAALLLFQRGATVRQQRLPVAPAFITAFASQMVFGRWLPMPF